MFEWAKRRGQMTIMAMKGGVKEGVAKRPVEWQRIASWEAQYDKKLAIEIMMRIEWPGGGRKSEGERVEVVLYCCPNPPTPLAPRIRISKTRFAQSARSGPARATVIMVV
ncbi:hypothetical protein BY996DRAFT_6583143 [Phakopsora pachyrhizi]|nr:hypothetical protein BY996DRAFT_6583143 [Phakopsora pachyrhizi]